MKGYLIVLLSVILSASLNPLIKKANRDIPIFTVMAISMLVLSLFSVLLSLIVEKSYQLRFTSHPQSLMLLIVAGVINVVALWLIILGFKYMPLWQQSLFSLLIPLFTAIFSYVLLQEPFGYRLIVGLLIMGFGLFIAIK